MKTILTVMCLIYRNDGSFLVQDRQKLDWPGINLPGGHVEPFESILEAVKREMKEETNLDIHSLEKINYIEWLNLEKQERHLCLLFRTNDFSGDLKSSKEGKVFFIKRVDLIKYHLSLDFDKVLEICTSGLSL